MSLDKYDSWKLASPDDDPNLVSPCCGDEYTELEFRREDAMYKCSKCEDLFEYPEETHEFKQQRLEDAQEAKMDAERDES
tara:strand:- start:7969 stop:8208 length:240 start_codon:yes stop_codon:yes gene_type:complete